MANDNSNTMAMMDDIYKDMERKGMFVYEEGELEDKEGLEERSRIPAGHVRRGRYLENEEWEEVRNHGQRGGKVL